MEIKNGENVARHNEKLNSLNVENTLENNLKFVSKKY